jgi:hypothetical protein
MIFWYAGAYAPREIEQKELKGRYSECESLREISEKVLNGV